MYASAAAVLWALVATLIKATTDTLAEFGVAGMFTHWPRGAWRPCFASGSAVGRAAAGLAAVPGDRRPDRQHRAGHVAVDERFTSNGAVLALAATGFAVMCAGVVLLTQTAPATMTADASGEMARRRPDMAGSRGLQGGR